MQNKSADVLVLGAGIVGLSLALKLQERDRHVLLVDRALPGAATSFGNAGLIERSTVFPYAFPRDLKTLLAYALGRRHAAHYHWHAMPSLLPWMWRYWKYSSPALYPRAIAGALPLIEHSWSEHLPLINAVVSLCMGMHAHCSPRRKLGLRKLNGGVCTPPMPCWRWARGVRTSPEIWDTACPWDASVAITCTFKPWRERLSTRLLMWTTAMQSRPCKLAYA